MLALFCALSLWSAAQEVVRTVSLQRVNSQLYRVRFSVQPGGNRVQSVDLRIFRRRAGVEEAIFSQALSITATTYDWRPERGAVQPGDELQARIAVTYAKGSMARTEKPPGDRPPVAHAGAFIDIRLPLKAPLLLDGRQSSDPEGALAGGSWKQIEGPVSLSIGGGDSLVGRIDGGLKEGVYAFELTVKDRWGQEAKDRMILTVKPPLPGQPADAVTAPPVQKDTAVNPSVVQSSPAGAVPQPLRDTAGQRVAMPAKRDTAVRKPALAKVDLPPLKGGPSNALLNLLLPGVGHYYVSGDQYGNDRKPAVLLITALYAGAVGGAIYYKLRSNSKYDEYLRLANHREYQYDDNGNIIGVRGVNQGFATQYLNDAKTAHRNAVILAGVSVGILTADFIYTLIRGARNKAAWNRDARVQAKWFITPGTGMTAGVRIHF